MGVNGYEWPKRQATQVGVGFVALTNGLGARDQPERLQAIRDRGGPDAVEGFFDRQITPRAARAQVTWNS